MMTVINILLKEIPHYFERNKCRYSITALNSLLKIQSFYPFSFQSLEEKLP